MAVLEKFGIRGAKMPAFSASAIVLELLWDQVRRQNILGLIVQLEVSPKLMQTCSFLSKKGKMAYKASDNSKYNMTLGLLCLLAVKGT